MDVSWPCGRFFVYFEARCIIPMARLDLLLTIVFGTLSVLGLVVTVLCLRMALRVASEKDGDLKMFFWAVGSMMGLILAGVSSAYILLPILLHY